MTRTVYRTLLLTLAIGVSMVYRVAAQDDMDGCAEAYVKLALAVGQHAPAYVDAYYGPDDWQRAADAEGQRPLGSLARSGAELVAALERLVVPDEGMEVLRHRYLKRQAESLVAYVRILDGHSLSFDEESQALYDAVAPTHGREFFEATIHALDKVLPGGGALSERLERFRSQFVIPKDRMDAVFDAAIAEGRKRTASRLDLPRGEAFTLEYVNDKPWSGYNWYQGNGQSLIQINTDLPIYIDRAVDLACHEGYPGHHVYNALLEKNLVGERGWVEFSVYALYSPQSLIAEGTANYGIEMAFPGAERAQFEREVLFPLAGLDAAKADSYYQVQELLDRLSYAGNEAARGYLDGDMTREETVEWLIEYALFARNRAEQRVKFIETYRSYVINYNLGLDLVRQYVESQGGTAGDPERRWQVFGELLSSPRLPSGLR